MRTVALPSLMLTFCVSFGLAAEPAAFGRHYPNGAAAVEYLYGPNGTWKDQAGMSYLWNYYAHCETIDKPADLLALLSLGSSTKLTSPDVDCLLLGDLNNNGDIEDDVVTGYAFHEHNGRGANGLQTTAPFLHFWFDDNWLARYVAIAYERPQPSGLHDQRYTLRWRALGGDAEGAAFYSSPTQIDQLALNAILKLNRGDLTAALADWHSIKAMTGWIYDWEDQRYEYPEVRETYHLGLWGVLTERLLAADSDFWDRNDVLQHAESIRSNLLSLQQRDTSGNWLGWTTGTDDSGTLINTETVSVAVLALGAAATWVFEPGQAPLRTGDGRYFPRPYHAVSAVAGLSGPGHVVYGPYWRIEPGTYQVEFSLRSPSNGNGGRLATVDVYDGNAILAIETVTHAMMPGSNQWLRHRLTVEVTNPENEVEFRVYWHGSANLDVGAIRVLRLSSDARSPNASAAASTWRRPEPPSAPLSLRELLLHWLAFYSRFSTLR